MRQGPGNQPEPRAPSSSTASAVAGLVGGLVGSWLMVEFQHRIWPSPKGGDGASSTTKLAKRLAGLGSDTSLTEEQARSAGEAIHYALGAGLGALYGAAVSLRPAVATGAGLPFGIATEVVIDQVLVPVLGLSKPFWKCPATSNLRGLTAHLIFGSATEASRRILLSLVSRNRIKSDRTRAPSS